MTPIDNDLADFRSQAVAASEALQRTLPKGVSLEKSGISYCLVRQPCLTRLRAPIKVTAVACGVLGLSGVAAGGIIGLLKREMLADNASLLTITICCFFGGILLLLLPTYVERWIVRRHLTQHDDDYESESGAKGIHICLEYAPTYGSTLIAAEMTRRHAFLMELDPLYCDVIVQRWQNFTGKQAQRDAQHVRRKEPPNRRKRRPA